MLKAAGQTKGFSFLHAIAVSAAVLISGALFFPSIVVCRPEPGFTRARNDVAQLVTAMKAYNTEYGRLPLADRHGAFIDETSQALLLRVLQGLDHTANPRRVVFFEAQPARRPSKWSKRLRYYHSELHPTSEAFLDPWGQPYRVLLDVDYDEKIQSPYQDSEQIRASAIAWSIGKDGIQGSPGRKNILKESDDVVSWR